MTTTDPRARLDEIKARADAATEGPWGVDQSMDKASGYVLSNNVTTGLYDLAYTVAGNIPPGDERDAQAVADAEFIAHARTDIPELIELVNEQRADLERTKRGAHTLGQIIEQHGRDVLDATGMHDVINADGDGDWQVVWEKLSEMGGTIRKHQAALTAVLDVIDTADRAASRPLAPRRFGGEPFPAMTPTSVIRQAITSALGGDRG